MGRDQHRQSDQFEWVNIWAAASGVTTDVASEAAESRTGEPAATPVQVPTAAARFVASAKAAGRQPRPEPQVVIAGAGAAAFGAVLPDQLMRDMAEIARVRDALANPFSMRRLRTFMVVPSRTAESVPLVIGGVFALVLLTVFGTAAAVTRLGR